MLAYALIRKDGSYVTNMFNKIATYETYEAAERVCKIMEDTSIVILKDIKEQE